MADIPMMFSGPMVRALLNGTKTQTRRILKPQPSDYQGAKVPPPGMSWVNKKCDAPYFDSYNGSEFWCWWDEYNRQGPDWIKVRWAKGDRLWVREHWRTRARWNDEAPRDMPSDTPIEYIATPNGDNYGRFRQSMHMPRWASRLTLEVIDVRVERLQDISEADALAEGMTQATADAIMGLDELAMYAATHILCPDARGRILYETIWDRINGDGAWDANPFVVAVSFECHRGNIDQMGRAS